MAIIKDGRFYFTNTEVNGLMANQHIKTTLNKSKGIITRAGVCKTLCPQLPDTNTA